MTEARTVGASDVDRLLSANRYASPKRLQRYAWRAFSQTHEDGIISEIFRRIGTTNRRFVEIGTGGGRENNTAYLLGCGWSGNWFEADSAHRAAMAQHRAVPLREGAFFVRDDLLGDAFEEPFTAENHYEHPRYDLVAAFASRSGHPPRIGAAHVATSADTFGRP